VFKYLAIIFLSTVIFLLLKYLTVAIILENSKISPVSVSLIVIAKLFVFFKVWLKNIFRTKYVSNVDLGLGPRPKLFSKIKFVNSLAGVPGTPP